LTAVGDAKVATGANAAVATKSSSKPCTDSCMHREK
jgi:hypothetical protein